MADVAKLRDLLEAYGVAVRAGVITPCLQDENEFRKRMGLPQAPAEVEANWERYNGIREPITLRALAEQEDDGNQPNQPPENQTNDNEE